MGEMLGLRRAPKQNLNETFMRQPAEERGHKEITIPKIVALK